MSMTMWEFQVFEALSFAFCNQQISRHTKKSITLNKGHALFALVNEIPYPGMPG